MVPEVRELFCCYAWSFYANFNTPILCLIPSQFWPLNIGLGEFVEKSHALED